jgi:hypothetical protein
MEPTGDTLVPVPFKAPAETNIAYVSSTRHGVSFGSPVALHAPLSYPAPASLDGGGRTNTVLSVSLASVARLLASGAFDEPRAVNDEPHATIAEFPTRATQISIRERNGLGPGRGSCFS